MSSLQPILAIAFGLLTMYGRTKSAEASSRFWYTDWKLHVKTIERIYLLGGTFAVGFGAYKLIRLYFM